jgi:uncharacterized protein (DUF2147 family)
LRPFILLLLGFAASVLPSTGVLGDWKTPDGSTIRIQPCGSAALHSSTSPVCMTIVQVSPTAPATVDVHNPNPSLRNRPLCGLLIGSALRHQGSGHAYSGRVYDPRSGRTYKGTISTQRGELKLHGYIGISLFGRTEVWPRSSATSACHP